MPKLAKILSGGQQGADIGGLFAARKAGIPTGGWAPKGFRTEAGQAGWLQDYGLLECETEDYPTRTRRNVGQSDGVIWFGNPHSPGGKLTLNTCHSLSVDYFVVIDRSTPEEVAEWVYGNLLDPRLEIAHPTLMVAGNRESSSPGIGARVEAFLTAMFAHLELLQVDPPAP